ncbi:MAG: hypothetical protein OXR72_14365 [Gemmatimonadota bacterium]|nr:hypothetical protein [Gemmatimonadota bacterium]
MIVLFFLFSPDQTRCQEAGASRQAYQVVSRQEILNAMRQTGDYDPTATTNGARFQWEVIFHLAHRAWERNPRGAPLFINSEDWFRAFMEATGRTEDEMPLYARLSYEYEQHMDVEYRLDRVIRSVNDGPAPRLALNVRIWWEDRTDKADRYSYRDTLSTPTLKITIRRLISYRLLDLGDWFVCDRIRGLSGRPTSGLLGFIFRIIGDGRIVHSRMAVSADGLQIVRGTSKKGFMGMTTTATIYPDGEMIKDLPDGRSDLKALKKRIKQTLKVEYVEFPAGRLRKPKIPFEQPKSTPMEDPDERAYERREIYDGAQQGGRGAVDSPVAAVRRYHASLSD